jgi:hypothetical protein
MPHHPEDDRYLHLPLIREQANPERRKRLGSRKTRSTEEDEVPTARYFETA